MSGQGLFGALTQYWSVEPKARLHRRNTYFDDVSMTDTQAIGVGIVVSIIAIAIIIIWSIGMIL